MTPSKADIIARLQKEILPLQGYKPMHGAVRPHLGLGAIESAFPNAVFPLGAIHEFISMSPEDSAATNGFLSAILSPLLQEGAALWIGSSRTLFPPALTSFGIAPERIIFIDLKREKDILWTMEEALQCSSLTAVVGEIKELGFTASRRLQLAVEKSRVTGFIHRQQFKSNQTTACLCRWRITPLSSVLEDDLPGVGHPRWQVDLLKARNGKPGTWEVEWSADKLQLITSAVDLHSEVHRLAI